MGLADDDSPDEGQEVAGGRVVQSGEGLLVSFAGRADEAFQFAAGRRIGGSCLHGLNRNGHPLSPEREGVEVDPAGGLDLQRPLLAAVARTQSDGVGGAAHLRRGGGAGGPRGRRINV